jgi:hypothetical protein
MNIYHFHPITKEFLGEGLADQDPMSPDNWLIPANATSSEPPPVSANEVAIYQNDGNWQVQQDYRNTLYYKPDGSTTTITEIGDFPEPDWSLEPIPKSLIDIKTEKLNEIRDDYKAAEIEPVDALDISWNGGFDSAIKLDAARRLSEAAGAPGVEFFDVSNVGHQLSFADALVVCITVASVYQNTLSKKQRLFKEVEAINVTETMTEAQAIEAVQAIVDLWIALTPTPKPLPTLAEVKAGKIEQIKAARDRLTLNGGHKIGENWYHSNEISLIQQIALNGIADKMVAAGAPDSTSIIATPWKTLSGAYVTLTVGIAKSFIGSALTQQSALFSAAQTKINQVEALTTIESVNAYDVNAGFPTVYQ